MRVFLAGATGVIGTQLVPQLLNAGHEVTAMTRSVLRARQLEAVGADPVVCDVFDVDGVRAAMADASPDAVIHQLTALPTRLDWGNPNLFDVHNRVRTEGAQVLLDAALASGASRVVAQSIAFAYAPTGDRVKAEDAALFTDAPPPLGGAIAAIVELEQRVTGTAGIEGLVLRYGMLYGPARITTGSAPRRPTSSRLACRSSRAPPACTAGCTSTTLRRRRSRRSSGARQGSTTSPTTSRRPSRSGCPSSRRRCAPTRPRRRRLRFHPRLSRCRCAAPPTRRPSMSSDGGPGTRAGAKALPQASRIAARHTLAG